MRTNSKMPKALRRGEQDTVAPATFLMYFLIVWMGALTALIGFRLLTGRIRLAGVLMVDSHTFSPARLQVLVSTVATLATYATASLSAGALAHIDNDLVALFALSHAGYLGPKAYQFSRKMKH